MVKRIIPPFAMHPDLPMFQRQPHEPPGAYHGFQHYRSLDSVSRTVKAAWDDHSYKCLEKTVPSAQTPGSWNHWSSAWSWKKRAYSYDGEIDRVDLAVTQAKAETWAAARVEFRERWRVDMQSLYVKLIERANEMLEYPLAETLSEERIEDESGVIIHREVLQPNKWRYGDMVRMVTAAQMIGLLIAESPNDVPNEEDALRAWSEREGIPFDKALEEYRRMQRELGA